MFAAPRGLEDAVRFSRFDDSHPLATISAVPFMLEDVNWPSVEHYYQAQKFKDNPAYSARIAAAATPLEAYRLGNRWWPLKRRDFKQVRRVLMTRAVYCKAQQNPAVADYLLNTGEQKLVETSMYDHYWGLGRDMRGHNTLGEVWMDVRRKLREAPTRPGV